MIDMQTVKDAYHTFDINDVTLVRSAYNISDALSKVKVEPILRETLMTGHCHHSIEQ